MTMIALLRSRIPRKGDVRFWRPTAPARVGVEFNYLPFIQMQFPTLAARYEHLYRRNSPPGAYSEVVQRRVGELKERYGIPRHQAPAKQRTIPPPKVKQLSLFGAS